MKTWEKRRKKKIEGENGKKIFLTRQILVLRVKIGSSAVRR